MRMEMMMEIMMKIEMKMNEVVMNEMSDHSSAGPPPRKTKTDHEAKARCPSSRASRTRRSRSETPMSPNQMQKRKLLS